MIINQINKEVCAVCSKTINIGQATCECYKCSDIIHTKCFKRSKFSTLNSQCYCSTCSISTPKQYNPFKLIDQHNSSDSDHSYNEELTDCISTVADASRVLDQCKSFSISEMETLFSTATDETTPFSTFFYNISGNKSNFDNFTAELTSLKHNFSVIGLAETNTDKNHSILYSLNGYKGFYNPCLKNKKVGTGVALYIHEMFNPISLDHLCYCNENIESLFYKLLLDDTETTVGIVYHSPNSDHSEFLKDYKTITSQLKTHKNVHILGDFNTDLFKTNDKNTKKFEEHFLTEGLYPTISIETHKWEHTAGSCIDNIFISNINYVTHSGTIPGIGKHHSPIFSVSNLNLKYNSSKDKKQYLYYNYSNENIAKFLKCLKQKPDDALGMNSSSEILNFTKFFTTFSETIDEFCKLKNPKLTKRTFANNPWITEGIITSITYKEMLYDLWKETCKKTLPGGDLAAHTKYSEYRKKLKHIITAAKDSFSQKRILQHANDHKRTWTAINQLRGKSKTTIKPSFIINNKRIIERRIIANEFNKYFVSLASNMNKTIEVNKEDKILNFNSYLPAPNPNKITLQDCTTEEISQIITELENGKSSDIPVKIIKKSNKVISPILARHFNYLMQTGKFPNELKIGKITPVYKKDDAELLKNYRPISTLPIFGKIFEKIIYTRLYDFCVSQNILHEKQFGFRKNHSTSHAINYSINHIHEAIKNKEHVLGIFIDLSKAFDTIDHKILLSKLENYGIRENAQLILKSYLSGRKQYVNILGEKSELLDVLYGVPQGSCLGPLLFLIYINDLCRASKNSEFILFADDTNIFIKAKTEILAFTIANEILLKVSNYMLVNKLHINMDKCCYMHFKPRNPKTDIESPKYDLKIGDTQIECVSETKFLGIIIDEKLTWDPQIQYLKKKLSCATGILNRIKDSIPATLHKNLYHTLFESHLCYGITTWGGVSDAKLKPLFKVQKKCIRILFGDKEKYLDKFKTCCRVRIKEEQILGQEYYQKEHTKPIFQLHKLMTVFNLYVYHCSMETFKILKNRMPISMYTLFSISSRKETYLITPIPTPQFLYNSSFIWNTVRKLLIGNNFSGSEISFKVSLKKFIFENQHFGDITEWNQKRKDCIILF